MTYAAAISGSQFNPFHSGRGAEVQVDGQASTPDRQLARQPGSQPASQARSQARTQPGTQADTHRCSRHVEGATLNPRNNGNNLSSLSLAAILTDSPTPFHRVSTIATSTAPCGTGTKRSERYRLSVLCVSHESVKIDPFS
eukprot:COSAG06_NODE_24323_length_666_cov_0.961199_1_plen_141_part_00